MKYHHVFLIGLLLLFLPEVFCQTIETVLEKREFKQNELINVAFETHVKVDSIVEINFEDFDLVDGPYKTSSLTIVNGSSKSSSKISYTLKAKRTGTLKIVPPKFYGKNGEIVGASTIIIVSDGQLTREEKKEIEFNEFIAKSSKPSETMRYVIKDEMGYVEIYKNLNWEFSRKLTKKEIKKIKKIK